MACDTTRGAEGTGAWEGRAGKVTLPSVRWRATCEGAGLHSPSLVLLESFAFHKHKSWKWLRRMEPPQDHCLGWEWVSRQHIGEVVGDSQLQRACWGLTGNGSSWVGGGEGGLGSSSQGIQPCTRDRSHLHCVVPAQVGAWSLSLPPVMLTV